jgi:molecular chaperone DnaJ
MASKRDYYEVLGVARNASPDEIRRAFRRLARQYHPDVNRDASAGERFKEINEAYEVLSNAEKRRHYDRFGHAAAASPFGSTGAGFGIDEIFETFFGGMGRGGASRRPARGADLRYDLELSFDEAVFGVTKEIEVPRTVPCSRCGGGGAEPGSSPARCPQCNGAGEVRRVQQSIFGQFVNVTVCDRCRGRGEVITQPCKECGGRGAVQTVRRIAVPIPAGVDDGQQMHLPGEGELGARGGPPGDLYVVIAAAPHDVFKRQDTNIIYDLLINVAQAALGDELEVPTIDGREKLKIPPGTQSGAVLRLRGKGVPRLRGPGRGDQLIRVRVVIPQELTEEQRQLFERLAASFNGHAPADGQASKPGRGLFDRVKDVLGGD